MVVGSGAIHTSSPWRSEIFEKLRATQHTLIHLPYDRQETLPLIHVTDVADSIQCLIRAGQIRCPVYNTSAENWRGGDLADYLKSLNRYVELTFSPSGVRGDPEAITGRRFVEEFGFRPLSLAERLRQAVAPGAG
jgi:nucleoside-diphosphate-sugar epimerase